MIEKVVVTPLINWPETCIFRRQELKSVPRESELMKTVKLLALLWVAVTVLAVGAWAQSYPDQGQNGRSQAPGQSASGQGSQDRQGAPDQGAQDEDQADQAMDQTQGP